MFKKTKRGKRSTLFGLVYFTQAVFLTIPKIILHCILPSHYSMYQSSNDTNKITQDTCWPSSSVCQNVYFLHWSKCDDSSVLNSPRPPPPPLTSCLTELWGANSKELKTDPFSSSLSSVHTKRIAFITFVFDFCF